MTSWDVLRGEVVPTGDVLFYDDNGTHSALSAAELIARSGARLEIVTPERMFGIDKGTDTALFLFLGHAMQRERGFPRIDVRADADVSKVLYVCHCLLPPLGGCVVPLQALRAQSKD